MYITTSTEKRIRYSVTMRTIQYGLVNSAMGQIPCSTERISCYYYDHRPRCLGSTRWTTNLSRSRYSLTRTHQSLTSGRDPKTRRTPTTCTTCSPTWLSSTISDGLRSVLIRYLQFNSFAQSSKMGTVTKGFDARLTNRSLLVFDFRALWRSTLSARVPESQN